MQKQGLWTCLRFPFLTSKQLSFWTRDRNNIHSISEYFSFTFGPWIGMLENFGCKTTNIIVLDLEGFKLKSVGFIIRELSWCSSYNDAIFFKPPLKFPDLPAHDRQTDIWLNNNLHGLDWDEGDIPYCDLKTICLSFSFRFTRKNFFAKGIEKFELLSKLLQKTVYNLEDLNCPQISEIISEEQVSSCYLHSDFRSTNDQLPITARNLKQINFYSGHKVMHRKDTATLTTYLSDNLMIFTCLTPIDDQPIVIFNSVQDPSPPIQINFSRDQQNRANYLNKKPNRAQQPRYSSLYSAAAKRYIATITLSPDELGSFSSLLPVIESFCHFQLYVKNKQRAREHRNQFNYGYEQNKPEAHAVPRRAANPELEAIGGHKSSSI